MASSQASAATASQPPRLPVMDPRETEFASKTYFEKYQQERAGGQTADVPPVPSLPESKFILPIRGLGASECEDSAAIPLPEQKKRKGFGLNGFRFRKPLAPTSETPLDSVGRDLNADATRPKSFPFDQLFVSLPPELQIQIIASLPLSDILNLRLASRSWHGMITMNEVPIARYHLAHHIPAYAKRLYPVPTTSPPNFHYLCGLWHRLHVAAKLAHFISERVTKEIFLRTTEAQLREFAPSKERMRRRLIPLIFTIFHFFETYREKHIQYLNDHNGMGLHRTPYTINPIEAEVMNMYDDRTLLQVHQVFPLVVASFCRRLRPPSYAGRVERSLRGYLKDKPADEVHVAALCIGGLRQVEKFWEIKGYNNRRAQVDNWYKDITQEPDAVPANSKPKRGLMGLGRKKSMAVLNGKESSKASSSGGGDSNGCSGRRSVDSGYGGRRNSLIFTTSLSAGMPMGPLPKDHLRMLLSDLPSLQQLWLTTAEALILDRKIVERSVDIKRNAPMLMDLIRDSGMEDEDQWWYGHGGSDSIRPPPGATDDDLL